MQKKYQHLEIEKDIAKELNVDKALNGDKNLSATLRRWREAIEKDRRAKLNF